MLGHASMLHVTRLEGNEQLSQPTLRGDAPVPARANDPKEPRHLALKVTGMSVLAHLS